MARLFFSYSHKDEALRNQLETHLALLKRQGVISTWNDRCLIAGDSLDSEVMRELEEADVILLLVSADYLASEYCYGIEMKRALERNATKEARVIPIILRPCDWRSSPFGSLLAAPTDGRPVTKWPDPDDAFLEIVKAIRGAVGGKRVVQPEQPTTRSTTTAECHSPRSSNLRMRKTFTERDQDKFLDEAFEFMASFFENSVAELSSRNAGIEGSFKRIDRTKFLAAVYHDGKAQARCQIRLGGMSGGITFSYGGNVSDNSITESLSVEIGEQALVLKPLGMQVTHSGSRDRTLGLEGASEYYWSLFVEPLQR